MHCARFGIILLAVGLAAAATAQVTPRSAPRDTSWGKPGVTMDEYRGDAVTCARMAANLDISGTEAAQTLVAASRAIDNAASSGWMAGPSATDQTMVAAPNLEVSRTREAFRVDEQIRDVSELLYDSLAACLRARGYRQFRLTNEQRRQLRRLRHGSDARRVYLHSLASNPAVLETQGL